MKLTELIRHYNDRSLPRPAYATLCALEHLAWFERCRYVVQCNGVTVAAFAIKARAEQFAELGRMDTPGNAVIEVVDIDSSMPPAPSAPPPASKEGE